MRLLKPLDYRLAQLVGIVKVAARDALAGALTVTDRCAIYEVRTASVLWRW